MKFLNRILITLFFSLSSLAAVAQDYDGGIQPERTNLSKSIKIFPNPATEYVHLSLDILKASTVKITLHNILGNQITVEQEETGEHEVRLRIKDLPTGYYLIALRDEESRFKGTYKFLKR